METRLLLQLLYYTVIIMLLSDVCVCVCVALQMLLSDFSHHHIEMACTLLETSGRFLFRSPDSHLRTSVLLVQTHTRTHGNAYTYVYSTGGWRNL